MPESNWFESWFDSHYYHILYRHRNEAEAAYFLDHLTVFLKLPDNAKIWDMACGKGRHVIHLLEKGFDAIGSDLSRNSILKANQHSLITSRENDSFFVHDMRESLKRSYFDLVLNIFTSIGYFDSREDNQKVFSSAYDSLKPGGIFVIDFFNAKKVVENIVYAEKKNSEGVQFEITRNLQEHRIIKKIIIKDLEKIMAFEERVELLDEFDFMNLASVTGFEIIQKFGSYALDGFDKKLSDRLIIVFQKKR